MPRFIVDEQKCHKDGICALVCPLGIIRAETGSFPELVTRGEDRCIACGQCLAFCPHQACAIDSLPSAEVTPLQRELLPTPEAVDALCRSRRSIRQFKQTPVPKDTLLRILDTARFAPSAKHAQPVRWIILHERSRLMEVGALVADWMQQIADSGTTPGAKDAGLAAAAWRKGKDPFLRGAPHLCLAVVPAAWDWGVADGAIALTYVELAAASHGVGCCWAGYVTRASKTYAPLRQNLGIGDEELLAGAQMMGYPALRPMYAPPRKQLQITWG